jgi:DNA-binding response OmpR family regulator
METNLNIDSKRILIIDDDENLLDILCELFAMFGCEAICASNANKEYFLYSIVKALSCPYV